MHRRKDEAISGRIVARITREFLRHGLTDRFTHDQLYFLTQTRPQRLGMGEDELAHRFAQPPFQHQVHTLHDAVNHLVLKVFEGCRGGRVLGQIRL